ncbi:Peptidase_M23 domain-containing protein [Helicobacter sp. NHP19-012]|uniref:Peptidase_M23 domain-containing protein n=1 Tax=Helicobacter gastrofelis TaxID=2849642 RepID=A0ABM7SNH5_9HELI|nr:MULTISPECIES: peptidoglycan DD-metalloendopeptidase family protein [unclassified Helicobacter]BCZ19137.1 Peptidase_M23 domain-containing protein [Helicobacter sp. NHP19-012]GMB96645.1 Peptidase_M23 domain-containing protein [Helicobacter sp. NHP22-001]
MKRCIGFLVWCLSLSFLGAQAIEEIDKNISLNQSKLKATALEKTKISNRLSSLGDAINQKYQQSQELSRQIQNIQRDIAKNQAQNQAQEKSLEENRLFLESLQKSRSKIQDFVTTLLLKDMLFVMVLDKQDLATTEDIMLQTAFKYLSHDSRSRLATLNAQEEQISTRIAQIVRNINQMGATINAQENRKHNLQNMVATQQKLIKNMRAELVLYNKKLENLDKERKELDQLLVSLNIVKQRELERQRHSQRSETTTTGLKAPLEVRQVASSYRNITTTVYNGPKTIAPLASYKIVQKFGPYFDPVYKLKVFNEAVTLVSTKPNAVVRNIFDGRVVYAKEVPILKKVIIIEHKDGMHTIYSQLDKIAPTIRHGLRVQKGYVIGRIDQRLSFEVTLKDKHINPMEIIARTQ